MIYYKVPKKLDQLFISTTGYTLIGGELLTDREAHKMGAPIWLMDVIHLNPKKDTYMFFGCRFQA